MAIDTISSKIFFGYFAVVGAIFVATAGPDMVNDMMHVDQAGALCNGCAPQDRGDLDALSLQVGTVYCQVLGAMALMTAAAVYFDGSRMRTFMTMLPFVGVQAKHILVDGLIPPVPVMILSAGVLILGAYTAFIADPQSTDYSKYAFIGQMCLNLVVFVMDPGQIVKESFEGIDGAALGIGTIFVGVVQLYAAMFIVLFAVEDAPLSQFVCMTLGMGQLYRDVVLNESGPPLPVLVLFVGVFLSSVYGYFVEGGAAAKKARTD